MKAGIQNEIRSFGVSFLLLSALELSAAYWVYYNFVQVVWPLFTLGTGYAISGVGVLRVTKWGWRLTLGIAMLVTASILVEGIKRYATGIQFDPAHMLMPTGYLAWNGFVMWYFLRPSVKAQFQKRKVSA